ncbi:MAG TPA: oligosaccharide flippase family protein [Polyangia bacterium]|nr:oligosaccharide flippase family protein [Polyangia bacterium]
MSLARKAFRGAAWSIATSLTARVLGLVGTLVLVRYLRPDEYGEVSAASVLVLTASQFSTLGVGQYVIANPKAPRPVVFHATLIHITLGLVALAAVVALRGPLGPVFDAPTMGRYVPGLALAVLMDRVSFMPERLLVRDMRFQVVAIARSLGEVAYTVASVGLAMAGWGGMSIVIGNLARSLVRALIEVGAVEWREWAAPSPIRAGTLRELAVFGIIIAVAAVAGFASRRWDNLLVSRFFGPAVLGAYNLAYNLADVPATQVGEQVTDVLLSSFAQMEMQQRRRALLRSIALLGLIMFPLAAGLGAVAPTLVHTFFDRKWAQVAPMLAFLSVLSVPRPIGAALGAYLLTVNRPRLVMWLECLQLALIMAALASIGRVGPLWACGAVGATFIVRALAGMWALRAAEGIPVRSLLTPLLAPLCACVPMVAAVLALPYGLRSLGITRPAAVLVTQVGVGALVYVGSALVIARAAARELIELARHALAARRQPAAETL